MSNKIDEILDKLTKQLKYINKNKMEILELKTTITEIQNSVRRLNSRWDTGEESWKNAWVEILRMKHKR